MPPLLKQIVDCLSVDGVVPIDWPSQHKADTPNNCLFQCGHIVPSAGQPNVCGGGSAMLCRINLELIANDWRSRRVAGHPLVDMFLYWMFGNPNVDV